MRYRARGLALLGVAAMTMAACWYLVPAASAASAPRWRAESLPNLLIPSTTLLAGAAVSANDAWAVGDEFGITSLPLIVHWNGQSWSKAATTGITNVQLAAVVATARETWVSATPDGSPADIYRLSGSRWAKAPSPAVPNALIAGGPGGQVWAVGQTVSKLARWTGTAWHLYQTGLTTTNNGSFFISALGFEGSTDGWAVGEDGGPALVLRWNGTSWHKTAAPALPTGASSGDLTSVLVTPSGVWATGQLQPQAGGAPENWLVHWNGSSWATVPLPAGFGEPNVENISAGKSGQPQWIGGDSETDASTYLHYSGGAWSLAAGATAGDEQGFSPHLVSIPGTSATWAVGTSSVPPEMSIGRIEYSP
jgi:hypothetical protein